MSNNKKQSKKAQTEQSQNHDDLNQDIKTEIDEEQTEINNETDFEQAANCSEESKEEDLKQISPEQESNEAYSDLQDKYIRLVAEYDNFRKRTRKEKDMLYNSSLIDVCKVWLPVLDNLDRAVEALDKLESSESEQMSEGLAMVQKQANDAMEQLGVKEIKSLGERFDPQYHEAIAHVDNPEYGEDEIFEVIKKGYIKGDTVIRHSVVCVAN